MSTKERKPNKLQVFADNISIDLQTGLNRMVLLLLRFFFFF